MKKSDFKKIASNPTEIQKLWIVLCGRKKCIWCKKKFENGIIRKSPKQRVPLSSYYWFTAEFLVHAQTTHGYSPDIIDDFLKEIRNKIKSP